MSHSAARIVVMICATNHFTGGDHSGFNTAMPKKISQDTTTNTHTVILTCVKALIVELPFYR